MAEKSHVFTTGIVKSSTPLAVFADVGSIQCPLIPSSKPLGINNTVT